MIVWYIFGVAALYGAFPHIIRDSYWLCAKGQRLSVFLPIRHIAYSGIGLAIFCYAPPLVNALFGIDAPATNPITNFHNALTEIAAFYHAR